MDLDNARTLISEFLNNQFGKVCDLREVSVERSTTGRVFTGEIYCVTKHGEVSVGKVGVSEEGEVIRGLTTDDLTDALMAIRKDSLPPSIGPSETDFSLLDDEEVAGLTTLGEDDSEGDDLNLFFAEFDSSEVMQRIIGLLTSGNREDLLKARQLMPRLLVDHEKRGTVLMYMGELEIRLDEPTYGLNYLEAAACEFADVGNIESLERSVALAAGVLDAKALSEHATTRLLNQTLTRLAPLAALANAPSFSELDSETVSQLGDIAEKVSVPKNEIILKEGAPATQAFVIESGILGINLETPGGASRTVRCCFPGEFVGESCIEGAHATCNATVYTKQDCVLYRFNGEDLMSFISRYPVVRERLESNRTIHRLDSFFSMNESTNTLDVRVRDRLIGCIVAIQHVAPKTVVEKALTDPSGVYLVARGRLEKHLEGGDIRVYGPDDFACLKETLHKLPMEGELVAQTTAQLVVFDPGALFELAMAAPPDVAAVLDRLE